MVEFINFKLFWVQLQICFSEGKCFTYLLFQRNHHLFPKSAALLLLDGDGAALLLWQTSDVVPHSRVGVTWRPYKHMMNVTGVKICLACLSATKETLEPFKLRGIYLKDNIQTEQFDLQKAFKQEKADDSIRNAANVALITTWGFT